MKIVLTHTEEFPFDCYEGNLANGEYAGAYLVKFKDCAHPELMFVTESQEFEDCCALENGSNIVERDQADEIEAWEPVDACEIASGEHYMPALTRPELLLLKTCLKRGGFNLPLEWRGMAKQLFARFDRDLQGEIQLATDGSSGAGWQSSYSRGLTEICREKSSSQPMPGNQIKNQQRDSS